MQVVGTGRRGVLVVGPGPTAGDDAAGKFYSGKSGKTLRDAMSGVGVDLERDCWVTGALICHKEAGPVKSDEVEYCRPNLTALIERLDPTVIIPMGWEATRSVVGKVWREDIGEAIKWTGYRIPCTDPNAWICPANDPEYMLAYGKPVHYLWWRKQLAAAFKLKKKPWGDVIPDYRESVEIIESDEKAAKAIQWFIKEGTPAAFDYETNMLKPDGGQPVIVCCSISNGVRTVAFPWYGRAVAATRTFLRSPVRKIASNLKFEERWSRAQVGTRVRNWRWDTMVNAHLLDNRDGITSIKFQSFVRLGAPAYAEHITPYLKTKGDVRVNQILKEIELKDLLLYCGLDSLLEFLVAEIQAKEMGMEL